MQNDLSAHDIAQIDVQQVFKKDVNAIRIPLGDSSPE